MGLAGAGVAEQHDRLAFVQVAAGCQGAQEGGGDGGDGAGGEVGQPLDAWEPGLGDAAGAAAVGAVVELGGQDLGEVGQVGGVVAGGDLGQPGGLGADGGQAQLAGGGADRGLGGGIGHAVHALLPGQQLVVGVQGRGGPIVDYLVDHVLGISWRLCSS